MSPVGVIDFNRRGKNLAKLRNTTIRVGNKFDDASERRLAKNYWSQPGTQPLTYEYPSHYGRVISEVSEAIGAKKIFEFGCAAGRNLQVLHGLMKERASLFGCDINENSIREGVVDKNLALEVGDEEHLLSYKAKSFDMSFTVSVLDHLPNPEAALRNLVRITRMALIFVEPVYEGAQGKIREVRTQWARQGAVKATPYTYFHPYRKIFEKLGLEVRLDVPMPTHLGKVGPFYRLMVVTSSAESGIRKVNWTQLADRCIASAVLQEISNRTEVAKAAAQLKKSLTSIQIHSVRLEEEARAAKIKIGSDKEAIEVLELKLTTALEKQKAASVKHKVVLAKYVKVRNSTKYRLGRAIVNVVKFPFKLVSFFGDWRTQTGNIGVANPNPAWLTVNKSRVKELDLFASLICERKEYPKSAGINAGQESICYVLHNSLPYASGGYAARTHGVATGLQFNGYHVAALTRPGFPIDTHKGLDVSSLSLIDRVGDVDYHRIAEPLRTGTSLRNYVEQAANQLEHKLIELNPQYVMAASFAQWSGLPALIAARRLGIPFFYEVRGFSEVTKESQNSSYHGSEKYKFLVDIEHLVCRNADHVFTLTKAMKQELAGRGLDPVCISLVPNSCDVERFVPRDKDYSLLEKLRIPQDAVVIGYIGTFVDYEGLDDLVMAVSHLRNKNRNFRLLLVGGENVNDNSVGPISKAITDRIKRERLEEFVIRTGRVPHHEIEAYYSIIDIAPFPRKPWKVCEMVSPMKPLEAMAMEKAVLVSSVGALAEMVQHNHTGLIFDKGSVESLSSALDQLVSDASLRTLLGREARKWVSKERTWANSTLVITSQLEKAFT